MVILTDELQAIAQELVRGDYLDRVHIGLDFFDASINRVAAWVIGTRAMLKALLLALLEPTETLRRLEAEGDYTARLALLEEFKSLPFGAVWDHYCRPGRPAAAWLARSGLRARRALDRENSVAEVSRRTMHDDALDARWHEQTHTAGSDRDVATIARADGHQQVVRRRRRP